jgi:hypothetical protein
VVGIPDKNAFRINQAALGINLLNDPARGTTGGRQLIAGSERGKVEHKYRNGEFSDLRGRACFVRDS